MENKKIRLFPNSPDQINVDGLVLDINPYTSNQPQDVINLAPHLKHENHSPIQGLDFHPACGILERSTILTPKRRILLMYKLLGAFGRQYLIDINNLLKDAERLKIEYDNLMAPTETRNIINKFRKMLESPLTEVGIGTPENHSATIKAHGRILRAWKNTAETFDKANKRWGIILRDIEYQVAGMAQNHPESNAIAHLQNALMVCKANCPAISGDADAFFEEQPSGLTLSYLRQTQRTNRILPQITKPEHVSQNTTTNPERTDTAK